MEVDFQTEVSCFLWWEGTCHKLIFVLSSKSLEILEPFPLELLSKERDAWY